MITETDIPTVFQTGFVEAAEVGTPVEDEEGATVGFQEVTSGAVRYAVDESVNALDGDVDVTTVDLVGEDEV